ncbi:MAG: 2Fe-2S iron-sulfur cluster-binding protein [Halieaceae bacterium]|jgi:NADPH-dependent 2,4-dienoyl-CoA reductase/sulfur reductase-like enzyme|nr:2Fe-2S iron-sulfur cluster-binding protein [Halieaceae bacterium]
MRVSLGGVARAHEAFHFSFDGRPIEAHAGESVAAALISAGEMVCRETAQGEGRGLFCGMGVCGECTVLVNGQPRRSCMEMALPGLDVQRQPARRSLPASGAERPLAVWEEREVEILVIGAGPAGMAAAQAAGSAGASVLVVDERSQAGGQYFKQPGGGFQVDEAHLDAQFVEGRRMYARALEAGVEFLFATTVWGVFPGPEIAVASAGRNRLLRARRIILSPGAFERPRPFPGWTLPGVMTTGAAQTLLRAYQTAAGRRVVVAGNGPLNLQVGRELLDAGAELAAIAELAPGLTPGRIPSAIRMGLASPDLLLAGLGHRLRLLRAGVPLIHQSAVVAAEGEQRLEAVTLARVDEHGKAIEGTQRRIACDALCLGYGFIAQSELARALQGVTQVHSAFLASETERSPGIDAGQALLIGDAGGLGGARVAMAQGRLAGDAVARQLGYESRVGQSARELASHRRLLQRHRSFQRALWSYYGAPAAALAAADADTIVCRCESVSLGRLQALRDQGVASLGALKRESRAGMGRCQGRYCGALLRESMGLSDLDDGANFAPRPPFKPLTVAELAASLDESVDFDRTAGMATAAVTD